MTEQQGMSFSTGAEAAEEVAADPFWATVLQRHPDVDVVVLPATDDPRIEVPPDMAVLSVAQASEACEAAVTSWWNAILPGQDPTHVEAHWLAGEADGTARHVATWTRNGIEAGKALALIEHASALLTQARWSVFSPPEGLPRVMASRPGALGQSEMQVVLAPEPGRLVLRLRTELLHVGPDGVEELVRGGRDEGGADTWA